MYKYIKLYLSFWYNTTEWFITNNKAVVSEADTIDVVNSRCPAYVKGMSLQDAISGALATRQEVRTDYINVTKGK